MEMLTFLRADFPAQKVLIPRPTTTHDHVLEQAKLAQFKLSEVSLNLSQEIKYRKAACFHLARCAKDEHAKRQYKKEERNLFHRVAYSQLAEAIKSIFEEEAKEVGDKKNGKIVQEPVKPEKQPKRNDNVFVEESDNEDPMDP